jgi:predicted transposase YbfD/YdcC
VDWPEVGQVFEVERVRTAAGKTKVEVVYGITSLTREQASANELLGLVRGHWGIENSLHYVRDETLREDRCRARKGNAAQALATLRNLTVHLLTSIKASNKAAATRRFAVHPDEAIPLIQP